MPLAQSVSSYFFTEEPRQLFTGAEICARFFKLYKGDLTPNTVDRVIDYTQIGQNYFCFPQAGAALSSLIGRVSNRKFDVKTIRALSDAISQMASCIDMSINKIFESSGSLTPKLKVLGYAADACYDCADLKSTRNKAGSRSQSVVYVSIVKSVASLFLTGVSVGVYFGAQASILPHISLVLNTTVFITRIAQHSLEFKPKNISN
jgi:hypothetical protein